jgi:hypothetical protein
MKGNPVMRNAPSILVIWILLCAAPVAGQQAASLQVREIPDDIAYTAVFFLLRSAPSEGWDLDTRGNWLSARGFVDRESRVIVRAATEFCVANAALTTPAALRDDREMQQKTARLLAEVRASLIETLGPAAAQRFRQLITEAKKSIQWKGAAGAQGLPISHAWTFLTSTFSGDGARLAATAIAGTGGTDSHTIESVGIVVEGPDGLRSRADRNQSGAFIAQATAYHPLCGPSGCEDGSFRLWSTGTTERGGVTPVVFPVADALVLESVPPFHFFESVSLSPQAVSSGNGVSAMHVSMRASKNCRGTTEVMASGAAAPMAVKWGFKDSPSGAFLGTRPRNVPLRIVAGETSSMSFYYATRPENAATGTIAVTAAANIDRACKLIQDEIRQLTLGVD